MLQGSASQLAASATYGPTTSSDPGSAWAPFAHGFRPFFLLAGVMAPLGVGLWIASLMGLPVPARGPLPMPRWHGHEMLAGFVGAALGGFLLTAIPNWTGRRGYAGAPLVALVLVYLAGRAALLPGSPLPIGVAAPLALAFLPALLALVMPALVKAGTPRLFGPPAVILLFWTGDLLMLGEAAGWWQWGSWATGQLLCANAALLLVGLIGGRIIPAFTLNALRKAGRPQEAQPLPGVDRAGILSLVAVLAVDLIAPGGALAGGLGILAAFLAALRLSRWHGLRTLGQPILFILHLAYAFVPLALGMKGISLLLGAPWAAHWLHLQGAGALAVMILAVMTRATLGHTGRDLVARPATVAAYGLLVAAALARAFGPLLDAPPMLVLGLAGALWVAAFLLFLGAFGPMLLRARPDGKPG
jgi:uncharacterized protein involved in response to NO